jgi:nicotinamide-nucleotide amidase
VSARAGIVVTGTEVLSGRVSDRNGPWLADRLLELGVELALIVIVGDRPADMLSALRYMADEGMDVVLTSGGLGPTADDLTAEVVGSFQGREMVLDEQLEKRIAEILAPLAKRWPNLDQEAIRHSNRKQATIPAGASVLDPVGTAPGLVVPPAQNGGPTIIVLPGPPRELQPMWTHALETGALDGALVGAVTYRQRMLRLFGIPESEIAETLRVAEDGVELGRLEITTCMKRGEIEVVTRYEPDAEDAYQKLLALVRERHADTLYSEDGSSVDEQVAQLLRRGGASENGGGRAGPTTTGAGSWRTPTRPRSS